MIRSVTPCLLAALLAGCSLAPDMPSLNLPAGLSAPWRQAALPTTNTLPAAWEAFGQPPMETLIATARTTNTDLQAALARIKAAQGAVQVAQAAWWPRLDATATTQHAEGNAGTTARRDGFTTTLQGTLAYEADLFGATRSASNAARATALQSEFLAKALDISLQAQVATTYANLLAANSLVEIAGGRIASSEHAVGLAQQRLKAGLATPADVALYQTTLGSDRQTLATAQAQQATLADQLALLTGSPAQTFSPPTALLGALQLPDFSPLPAAEVLPRRPDVLAAEQALRAANANIRAARAAYFPTLSLSLAQAATFNPTAWATTLGAAAAGNIFAGGATQGAVTQATAKQEELLAAYRGTILTALQETNSALATLANADASLAAATQVLQAATTQAGAAQAKLDAGLIDGLTYQTAQQTQRNAETTMVQAKLDAATARMNLVKALGGPLR